MDLASLNVIKKIMYIQAEENEKNTDKVMTETMADVVEDEIL